MDVSIIIPAFNAEKTIAETFDSILRQKFDGTYEILVADDCSTDGTKDIIIEYKKKYPDVIRTFFRDKNLGVSLNYNLLAASASGEFLAFCDSDDVWTNSFKLQIQFDYLNSHLDCGLCCSLSVPSITFEDNRHVDDGEKLNFETLILGQSDIYNSSSMMRKFLFDRMSKECSWYIDNNCFFDTVWSYWFAFNSSIYQFSEPLMHYRQLEESDCRTQDKKKRYLLDKRYFLMKVHFLLTADVDIALKDKILSSEYDYIYNSAKWSGEMKVHNTLSYKIGKSIVKPLLWVKRIIKPE